jgi:hypothetical protein
MSFDCETGTYLLRNTRQAKTGETSETKSGVAKALRRPFRVESKFE